MHNVRSIYRMNAGISMRQNCCGRCCEGERCSKPASQPGWGPARAIGCPGPQQCWVPLPTP